jgi:hypothetical protein
MAAGAGVVECRDFVAVVLFPAAVLMYEDLLAEQRMGVVLEEWPEGLNEKLDGRRMVVDP